MSDVMHPLSITKLFNLVFREYKKYETIFGINKHTFFSPQNHPELQFSRYGKLLESPLGVAAGPQTQLSQNIIASWLTGSRYIELKTVQTLDELEVSKPCIDMEDEGYNCEWSQELKLHQSFDEYLNAWVMIHILKHELKIGDTAQSGMIFNMSVGYNLEGILNKNVQTFFEKMDNCKEDLEIVVEKLRPLYPNIDQVKIPFQITNNITLSTMHGCPPDEIEKIGMYLLEKKNLHTTIKLNPTLNGAVALRDILNNKLGFKDIIVPDLAFDHDLKYDDGIKLIKNLQKRADELNLDFGIKLTNTLETQNNKNVFDKSNEMMYMSGRPLHALAINLALKIQKEFNGKLDITFSAGVDAYNITDTLANRIKPVTVCTDLLKPGGYERTKQYVINLCSEMKTLKASNLDELVTKRSKESDLFKAAIINLESYLPQILQNKRYHKSSFPWNNIKTKTELKNFDCIKAPCVTTCPTNQDVPTYMHLATTGQYSEALEVIRFANPFPNTTGLTCDHACEDKCTRMNYDETLKIREMKRFIASKEKDVQKLTPKKNIGIKVGIIGAGPSGLSCAYYLAMEGFEVELFESSKIVGGQIMRTLPDFRTGKQMVERDIERIKSLGVKIHTESPVHNSEEFKKIQNRFSSLYVSIGAQKSKLMKLENEDAQGVRGFLEFLEEVKTKKLKELPKNVVVIGGGNSAIDTVRAAKRLIPSDGKISLIYRRTVEQMPANREEIEDLLEENIEICSLTQPKKIIVKDEKIVALECIKMKLGEPDSSGRRSPIEIEDSSFKLPVDYMIEAIGQDIEDHFLSDNFTLNKNGTVNEKGIETSLTNVYVGGDLLHGPSSIIQAIADGKKVAWQIAKDAGLEVQPYKKPLKGLDKRELKALKGRREYSENIPKISLKNRDNFDLVIETMSDMQAKEEANRCLLCDEICDVCVSVCPNRANIGYEQKPIVFSLSKLEIKNNQLLKNRKEIFSIKQEFQTLNVGDFCNECGNCATFCPTVGRPYIDKPKLYLSKKTFDIEKDNAYFLEGKKLWAKINSSSYTLSETENQIELNSKLGTFYFSKIDFSLVESIVKKDGVISVEELGTLFNLYDVMLEHDYLF